MEDNMVDRLHVNWIKLLIASDLCLEIAVQAMRWVDDGSR